VACGWRTQTRCRSNVIPIANVSPDSDRVRAVSAADGLRDTRSPRFSSRAELTAPAVDGNLESRQRQGRDNQGSNAAILIPQYSHRRRLLTRAPWFRHRDSLRGAPCYGALIVQDSLRLFAHCLPSASFPGGQSAGTITGGPLPIVGISMGAGIASAMAATRPDLVSGLALLRPAWLDIAPPPKLAPFPIVAELLRELGLTLRRRCLPRQRDLRQHPTGRGSDGPIAARPVRPAARPRPRPESS
jgi:hypothetical protein